MKTFSVCLFFLVAVGAVSGRTFLRNPAHPGWQMDTHFLKESVIYLRAGVRDRLLKYESTEFIAAGGNPLDISAHHASFIGRHTVMAYLGRHEKKGSAADGMHRLLFGWRFEPDYKVPERFADEIVVIEFDPPNPEKAMDEWSAGFDDAVTYFKAYIYEPKKLSTPEFKEIEKKLGIKVHRCEGDYAEIKMGETLTLTAVTREVAEKGGAE